MLAAMLQTPLLLEVKALPASSTAAQNVVPAGQETDSSMWGASITWRTQVPPLKVLTAPRVCAARQELLVAQETEVICPPPVAIAPGPVQVTPLKVPSASALTVRQNVLETQDTKSNGDPPLAAAKVPQPLEYLAAFPNWSTATQDEPTQDTEFSEAVPSMSVEVQAPPSYRHAVPSSTAMQKDAELQETEWKPWPGSTCLGGDHPPAAAAPELQSKPKDVRTRSEERKVRRAFRFDLE
jgi:hypothetical protein